jgi:hypothetical protein
MLEGRVDDLEASLRPVVNHDLPLITAAMRALVDEEADGLDDLPEAARSVREDRREARAQLNDLGDRVAALGDVGAEATTKEQKFAAVLAFAFNKRDGQSKVSVTPGEIRGCTGVSRRYAYELVEAIGEEVAGCRVREAETVQTGSGSKRKPKALLVDCRGVQYESVDVSEFTTGGES